MPERPDELCAESVSGAYGPDRWPWSDFAPRIPGTCPYCSTPCSGVIHGGPCPRVRSIEYDGNGAVKRVEFNEGEAKSHAD